MTENDKACQNCPKALECVSTDCSKRFVTEQMEEEKLIVQFAEELYGIWQEAKSGELDNWDDQTFEELPEKHKQEYYLTAKRLISLARAGYKLPAELDAWARGRQPASSSSRAVRGENTSPNRRAINIHGS